MDSLPLSCSLLQSSTISPLKITVKVLAIWATHPPLYMKVLRSGIWLFMHYCKDWVVATCLPIPPNTQVGQWSNVEAQVQDEARYLYPCAQDSNVNILLCLVSLYIGRLTAGPSKRFKGANMEG